MQNAAAALRVLSPRPVAFGPGDGESLENVNTTNLPNGALCWVVNTDTLYQLDKTVTLVSGITISPIAGPGTWFPLVSGGSTGSPLQSGEAICVAGGLVTIGNAGEWSDLSTLGAASFQGNSGPAFSLNTTSGALTYGGADGKWYEVSLDATLALDAAETDLVETVVDINGVLLPASTSPHAALATIAQATVRFQSLSASYFAQLDNGDVLTPLVRNNSSGSDVRVTYYQVHVVPVS